MSFPTGSNPNFGRDSGPAPPLAALNYSGMAPMDFGLPPPGTVTAMPQPTYYPLSGLPLAGLPNPVYYYNPLFPAAPPPYTVAANATNLAAAATQLYNHPNLYLSDLTAAGPAPALMDEDALAFPAANHINSTGGSGAEPGFNYFFPAEHAKIIVLKCDTPPWLLTPNSYSSIPFHAAKVPSSVTMSELLAGFGADNPDPALNQLWEVYPQGGGLWGWKESVAGDDGVMMGRTVKDMGWVERIEGELQTVYLWVTKA